MLRNAMNGDRRNGVVTHRPPRLFLDAKTHLRHFKHLRHLSRTSRVSFARGSCLLRVSFVTRT